MPDDRRLKNKAEDWLELGIEDQTTLPRIAVNRL
jgi:hypothetical protein